MFGISSSRLFLDTVGVTRILLWKIKATELIKPENEELTCHDIDFE